MTCGAGSKLDCVKKSHSCIKADSLKNFDALLGLKDQILKMKKEGQSKLATAIEKRKEIDGNMTIFLATVQNAVTQLQQINKTRLDELVSLQIEGLSGSQQEEQGLFINELISLLDESTSQDTIESLKKKMDATCRLPYETKLSLAENQLSEIEWIFFQFRTWCNQMIGDDCSSALKPLVLESVSPKIILSLFKSRIYFGEVIIQPFPNSPFSTFFKHLGDLLSSMTSSDLLTISSEKVFTYDCNSYLILVILWFNS